MKVQLVVFITLMSIFISQQFVLYLSRIIAGKIQGQLLFTILMVRLPELINMILPLSFFLGVIIVLGKMYTDNEIIIFNTVGISEWKITKITLSIALFIAILASINNLYILPKAKQLENIIYEQTNASSAMSYLEAGRFQKIKEEKIVIYIEKINKTELKNIFIFNDSNNIQEKSYWIKAQRGKIIIHDDQHEKLILYDGIRYEGRINSMNYNNIHFDEYTMFIPKKESITVPSKTNNNETMQLFMMPHNSFAQAELHWRLATPIAIILLTFIAVPFSRVNPRQGKFAKLLPSILIYLFYIGSLLTGKKILEQQILPIYMGLWYIHLIILLLGLFFILQNHPIYYKIKHRYLQKKFILHRKHVKK